MDANLVLIRKKVYDAISDILGVYTTKTTTGDVNSKAITVLEHTDLAYDYPIAGTGVKGLECVIVPANYTANTLLGGRTTEKSYSIILFQQDKDKGVREAIDRLVETDLQITDININIEVPKSETYRVAVVTVACYSLISFE